MDYHNEDMRTSQVRSQRRTVLFYGPYAGIWQHQLQQSQLIDLLDRDQYDVYVVNCNGAIDRSCAVLDAFGLDFSTKKQERVCRMCSNAAALTKKWTKTKVLSLSDFVSEERKAEYRNLSSAISVNEIPNYEYEKIPIGKLTSFEPLIKYKKRHFDFSEQVAKHWRDAIFQGLVTQEAALPILEKSRPDIVLVYSPQYASGSVFSEICKRKGIPVVFLEGSFHVAEKYSALHAWNWDTHGLVDPAIQTFSLRPEFRVDEHSLDRITKHLEVNQASRSFASYSTKKKKNIDLREEFCIPKDSKIILCALSSHDEIAAGVTLGKIPEQMLGGGVFKDQFEWISHTIRFAKLHPQLFFIVRLHPRLQANKREAVVSDELEQWRTLLDELPKNVNVDYPERKRSISNYFDFIDLLVTGWSSTAIDAMAHGVSAISYDQNVSWFPEEIVFAARSVESYEQAILRFVEIGRTNENVDKAFKWLSHRVLKGTIRVPGRLIDQLRLGNHTLVEKLYSVSVLYGLPILARIELLKTRSSARKNTESNSLDQLLSNSRTHLFGSDD